MAESKYGKYVISELRTPSKLSVSRQGPSTAPIRKPGEGGRIQLLYLDNEIIENAFYVECVWILPGPGYPGTAEPNAHAHEFDEVVTFLGNNLENPYDLGGEIELWLEDEPQILTRSCLVFMPNGKWACLLS